MTTSPSDGLEPVESSDPDFWHLRESYSFDRNVIAEIRRAANTGIYRIRGWGPSATCPPSTTSCSWGRRCRATPWRATGRRAAPMW